MIKRPSFDVDAVRDLAGEKSFSRGKAYAKDGLVRILAIEPGRVLAQVEGSEDYRTELRGGGDKIDGDCSCPAFGGFGFCKHMVAVALTANGAGGAASADQAGDALSRIRDHLRGRGLEALVEMIVGIAENDPILFRRLDMAASVVKEDDEALEARLRKAIDAATHTGEYVDYRRAPRWAAGVDAVLDTLDDLASAGRSQLVLDLAGRVLDRIGRAIGSIDDSDGHGGALLDRANEIYRAAVHAVRPEPVVLARDLFKREMNDGYGMLARAAAIYEDALGETGLAEYRRLALEAWEKLPPKAGRSRATYDDSWTQYRTLSEILDFFAERDGDLDTRIALRTKDLQQPHNYRALAEFCRSNGREQEALRWAEEGIWVFEDGRPDETLVLYAAGLLSKAGRAADAEAHLWRAFGKAPSMTLYERLANCGDGARDRALAVLTPLAAREKPTMWSGGIADLIVSILAQEKAFDEAWEAALNYRVTRGVKLDLARATEATHPGKALKVYEDRVSELVGVGSNGAYEEAVQLIRQMAGLRDKSAQSAYIATIKERYGRKRNFMKLLG